MNCPNCNVPLMSGMKECPKCRWLIGSKDGGPRFKEKQEADAKIALEKKQQAILAGDKTALEKEEQEKLSAELEKLKANFILTNTANIEGYRIVKYLGPVYGTNIYLVGGLIGGGLGNQENLYGFAFNDVNQKMIDKAVAKRANAIVGASYSMSSPGQLNDMIVVGNGTAVIIEKIEA